MLIIEDKGQKEGLHILKNRYFKSHDMEVLRAPLPVGDYIIATDKVADVMLTMQLKYGVEFVFCRPEDAGAKVIELLGGSENGGE